MWVARDKNGTLKVWKLKPSREVIICTSNKGDKIYNEFWDETNDGYNGDIPFYPDDYFKIDTSLFPFLTWEDEPIEVELVEVNKCTCDTCGKKFKYKESDIVDASQPDNEFFWLYVECPNCKSKNTI